MATLAEILAKNYRKECRKCEKRALVPYGYAYCLNCLDSILESPTGGQPCLVCGNSTRNKNKTKVCCNCLLEQSLLHQEALRETLDDEQKELFDLFKTWSNALNSTITLG